MWLGCKVFSHIVNSGIRSNWRPETWLWDDDHGDLHRYRHRDGLVIRARAGTDDPWRGPASGWLAIAASAGAGGCHAMAEARRWTDEVRSLFRKYTKRVFRRPFRLALVRRPRRSPSRRWTGCQSPAGATGLRCRSFPAPTRDQGAESVPGQHRGSRAGISRRASSDRQLYRKWKQKHDIQRMTPELRVRQLQRRYGTRAQGLSTSVPTASMATRFWQRWRRAPAETALRQPHQQPDAGSTTIRPAISRRKPFRGAAASMACGNRGRPPGSAVRRPALPDRDTAGSPGCLHRAVLLHGRLALFTLAAHVFLVLGLAFARVFVETFERIDSRNMPPSVFSPAGGSLTDVSVAFCGACRVASGGCWCRALGDLPGRGAWRSPEGGRDRRRRRWPPNRALPGPGQRDWFRSRRCAGLANPRALRRQREWRQAAFTCFASATGDRFGALGRGNGRPAALDAGSAAGSARVCHLWLLRAVGLCQTGEIRIGAFASRRACLQFSRASWRAAAGCRGVCQPAAASPVQPALSPDGGQAALVRGLRYCALSVVACRALEIGHAAVYWATSVIHDAKGRFLGAGLAQSVMPRPTQAVAVMMHGRCSLDRRDRAADERMAMLVAVHSGAEPDSSVPNWKRRWASMLGVAFDAEIFHPRPQGARRQVEDLGGTAPTGDGQPVWSARGGWRASLSARAPVLLWAPGHGWSGTGRSRRSATDAGVHQVWAIGTTLSRARIRARSITFCSSRMLPGQW